MRPSRDHQASPQLRPLGRCWLGAALIIVGTGPVLAAVGIGGSLWGLVGFLLIFTVAVIPLIARELRPAVSLVSSQPASSGSSPRQSPGAGYRPTGST